MKAEYAGMSPLETQLPIASGVFVLRFPSVAESSECG
jgi:hypothetical protein